MVVVPVPLFPTFVLHANVQRRRTHKRTRSVRRSFALPDRPSETLRRKEVGLQILPGWLGLAVSQQVTRDINNMGLLGQRSSLSVDPSEQPMDSDVESAGRPAGWHYGCGERMEGRREREKESRLSTKFRVDVRNR